MPIDLIMYVLANQAAREIGEASENFFSRNPSLLIFFVILAAVLYFVFAVASAGSGGSLGSGKVNDWLISKGAEWLDAPKCSQCLSTRNLSRSQTQVAEGK